MGLRSGNTVLICFRSGVGHFQSVLIALAADLHTNKPWQWTAQVLEIRVANSHLLCLVTWAVGSYLLQCCSGQVPWSPLWWGAPFAGEWCWWKALHGVPEHLPYWRYQECPGARGLSPHVPWKAEVVLWTPVHWQVASQWAAVSARSSFMQRSNCYGSPLESRLFVVKTRQQVALHAAIRPLLRLWGRTCTCYVECYCISLVWRALLVWQ